MKVKQLAEELFLKTCCADGKSMDSEIMSAYCGDLLSDVMAHVPRGAIWFTVLGHVNIVAVAQLRDVACIVLVNGVVPDSKTVDRAVEHGIAIFASPESSAQLCMKLASKFVCQKQQGGIL